MAIRPFPMLLIALASVGVAKLGFALAEGDAPLPAGDSLFSSAAIAASPEPEDEAAEDADGDRDLPQACAMPEEMLQIINTERQFLEEQKANLARREAEVALASEKLQLEQARLDELKGALDDMFAKIEAAKTDDVQRLVSLYSNMKPKDAAAIMNDLDIEVTVMVLGTMSERNAAPILASLNPVRARAISRIILERSKLPGDQRLDNIVLD
ncbi:MotE family protein [Pseudooceanicola sp. MF1-13]|uniref:MotE family protein n=1 Tax=Pseudooceanicola sp. MF1-13 TaxID=3379095 RepID=UPI0038923534